MRVALHTLGCKVNQAEAEAWARGFGAIGGEMVPHDTPADVVVVNTCSVTQVADRKSRQALRAARRRSPGALIVATGCYSAVQEDLVALVPEIDLVVPQSDKEMLVSRVAFACAERGLLGRQDDGSAALAPTRTRAFVKVADGCDRHCAFCVVPIARGRPRSRPIDDVLEDVKVRSVERYSEIVLTAVRLGLYGRDLPGAPSLAELVRRCLAETTGSRLRLSSLEVEDVTAEVTGLWQDSGNRLCRHLHLALDSGSDAVLARMRRRYTAEVYRETVARLREAVPEIAVTTDVIVGFPGETEAQLEETAQFVDDLSLAQVHVFPYSERPGTAAARLDGRVPSRERERRCARMLEVAARCASRHRSGLIGKTRDVLFEEPTDREGALWRGITDDYVRVIAPGDRSLRNLVIPMRIVSVVDGAVVGETL